MTEDQKIAELKPEVMILKYDLIYGSTLRIWVEIGGIEFKRLWKISGQYPPVWDDVNGHFGQVNLDKEKEVQLEAIFKAYCLEKKINPATEYHQYINSK